MSAVPIKVLVLARSYPNQIMPLLGLWVQRLVDHTAGQCDPWVVAPVPYCPPMPAFISYARFRRIPAEESPRGVRVWHPRFVTGPGYSLHSFEATAYYWSIRRRIEDLRRKFPFALIHAHFSYPDGVVAARLGQDHRVPVVVTEHAPWRPWMDLYPRVRRQAVWASKRCAFHIAVSRYVRNTIVHFTGDGGNIRVIPVGVDGSMFVPGPAADAAAIDRILYVGFVNFTKGVDILLHTMRRLLDQGRHVKLTLVGGSIYRHTEIQERRMLRLAQDLHLEGHVEFAGMKSPVDVAALMRESALLVLPSRAESFGAVLVEALACGIPVVATRCGGPEDIVTEDVGVLVPPEDHEALGAAIASVLDRKRIYDPVHLRRYALERFAWNRIAAKTIDLYHEALESNRHSAITPLVAATDGAFSGQVAARGPGRNVRSFSDEVGR